MFNHKIIPQIDNISSMTSSKINDFNVTLEPIRLEKIQNIDQDEAVSFKSLMTNAVKDLNSDLQEPEKMLKKAMVGENIDVHDIMIATTKAELNMTMATQLTTKFIQAYEKVISIQV